MSVNNANAAGREFDAAAFRQVLALDLLLYAALFWRDYHDPAQMVIAHYLSFVAITDLAVFFLPMAQRQWFSLFRASSGISYLVLVAALHAKGMDGESLVVSVLRGVLAAGRVAHALWHLRTLGPGWQLLRGFPAKAEQFFSSGTRSQRLGCGYLLVGIGLLYFPHVAYWTHFNHGANELDDILTGLQAQAGLNFCIKLFVFEVLVQGARARLAMRTVVATLFVAQWPLMPGMFYLAPLPIVHAVVEIYELALVYAGYREWRRQSLAR